VDSSSTGDPRLRGALPLGDIRQRHRRIPGRAILSGSTIQANGTALNAWGTGGTIFSYGNNDINSNGTPSTAPTVIGQH